MQERYKEVVIKKLKVIPVSSALEFVSQTSEEQEVYGYESKTIGWYYDLEEAKEAFNEYIETESDVIFYEIVGPEHGYGEPALDIDWDDVSTDEDKELVSDESPEYHFLYDRNKTFISSYFYDEDNPGGKSLKGKIAFKKGDLAYLRDSIYMGDNHYDLLIPVEIEGKVTQEYLVNKWKKYIKGRDSQIHGENSVEEPSEDSIHREIDSQINIVKDSLIFIPLVTVKCNWGEEPTTPFDDAPRIDFLTFQSVFGHETKFS